MRAFIAALVLLSTTLPGGSAVAAEIFAIDGSTQTIARYDAATGMLLGTIPTPAPASGNVDGLAASGTSLFFVNGSGSNVIHEIDASTGAELNAFPAPTAGGGTDGLAVVGDFLYSLDPTGDTIFRIDPASGSVEASCEAPADAVAGLAGEDDRLFAFLFSATAQIVELDPDDCSVIHGPVGAPDFLFGLGFDGERLYGSGAQSQLIYAIDPSSGDVLDTFDPGFVASGLAARRDGGGGGEVIEVTIDIKPGSCRNPLNPRSRGVTPVVLHGSADLDVALIDTETVHVLGVRPLRWAWGDEGGAGDCEDPLPDGHLDALLKFDTPSLVAAIAGQPGSDGHQVVLQLEGSTMDGTPFAGEDTVTLTPSAKDGHERKVPARRRDAAGTAMPTRPTGAPPRRLAGSR